MIFDLDSQPKSAVSYNYNRLEMMRLAVHFEPVIPQKATPSIYVTVLDCSNLHEYSYSLIQLSRKLKTG